jgi:hypothetical protein
LIEEVTLEALVLLRLLAQPLLEVEFLASLARSYIGVAPLRSWRNGRIRGNTRLVALDDLDELVLGAVLRVKGDDARVQGGLVEPEDGADLALRGAAVVARYAQDLLALRGVKRRSRDLTLLLLA